MQELLAFEALASVPRISMCSFSVQVHMRVHDQTRVHMCVGGVPYFTAREGRPVFFFAESVVAALIFSVSA